MIRVASIPHSDSLLLCAIRIGKLLQKAGHDFRLGLDASGTEYSFFKFLAEKNDMEVTPVETLIADPPDAVLFESLALAPHAFDNMFRVNFLPGIFWNKRYALFRFQLFALGNLTFSSDYLDPYYFDIYGGNIPALGVINSKIYSCAKTSNKIVFPDGFPLSMQGRKQWFSVLEKMALNNPDYEIVIKERFPSGYYVHLEFFSYKSFFSSTTPSNLRVVTFDDLSGDLIGEAACVVGCISSALVDAAMSGKKVCLVDADLSERYTGIPVTRDWFTRHGLRVSAREAIADPIGSSRMTAESLEEFAPRYFNGTWFVQTLEGIFERFKDLGRRNALKYDLSTTEAIERQLELIDLNSGTAIEERTKNLARYEYCQSLTFASEMLNLIDPDIINERIVEYLKGHFSSIDLPHDLKACRSYLEKARRSFADSIVAEVYDHEKLDYIFDPPMYYDTPFLMPGYYVADALKRCSRDKEANEYEEKLDKVFLEKKDSAQARYANAVAFKRMGRVDKAMALFGVLSKDESNLASLRAGSFFHMGSIFYEDGRFREAETCFADCLLVDSSHKKAKFLLDELSC